MRINNNMLAMNTHRQMGITGTNQSKSMEKLSSGMRINRAGDDAAGLSISEKMRGQIRGLNMASKNAQDGISMIQTAEGALNETHAILQRMRELTVQASNDTNNGDDRQAIAQELKDLTTEIDRISKTTAFNEKKLLNGDLGGAKIDATGELKIGTALATSATAITALDVTGAKSGENYTFSAGSAANKIVLTRASDSVSQEITLDATVGADGTMNLNFSELGVNLTISGAAAGTDAQVITDLTNAATDTITTLAGSSSAKFAIGANGTGDEKLDVSFGKFDSTTLGTGVGTELKTLITDVAVGSVIDNNTKADALTATINDAIKQVSEQRSKLGAAQNRLEHTIKNLDTSSENLQAAESRIRDVDMAKEMMNLTKQNILQQASQAMMAQANQQPQGVLQLLR
jgi:flagellin